MKENMEIVWEGQMRDNILDGFARTMSFHNNGDFTSYIGFWKDGMQHGYGKVTFPNGET